MRIPPLTTNSKPPPSRIRLCVRALVLGCLLLFAVCAQAGEAGPVGPDAAAASELDLRNCRLTLNARRALREETELACLNLGVSVRNGVATLWGSVTSADLAQRAVQKLRQVPGLSEVRNELSVVPPEELPRPIPRGQPPRAEPLPLDKLPRWPGLLVGLSEKPDGAREQPQPESIAAEGAALLPPVALSDSQPGRAASLLRPRPMNAAGNLSATIEKLRGGDERFRRVQVEVRQRTVYLRGTVTRGEDLQELAQAIARLPGVERVILEKVQVESNTLPGGSQYQGLRIVD